MTLRLLQGFCLFVFTVCHTLLLLLLSLLLLLESEGQALWERGNGFIVTFLGVSLLMACLASLEPDEEFEVVLGRSLGDG